MIKRTVEISREAAHLTVRLKQLLIQRRDDTIASLPCEDVGMVVVDHPGTTYSHAALSSLDQSDAVLVVCGPDHLPAAVLLPLADHSQVVWRLNEQIAAPKPLRKRLWQQLVRAKIRAQAHVLSEDQWARNRLLELAREVRSGDSKNAEAQAARLYWLHWLGDQPFRRDQDGDGLNALLNYGYAVMRAAVARAIVTAGLSPAIGLHHCNRANAMCLADDLVEPLRPLVDDRARELFRQGYTELDQEAKARMLELLALSMRLGGTRGPLMVALHRYTASLVRCFQGEAKQLEIPRPC
jgi:CRISPR-associated protein Cas1